MTRPQQGERSRPYRFWWAASLLVALIYALLALQQAVSHPFVVQDDARQFVFWMQRWQDPSLFPDDWIADYFESVTPWGFKGLYGLAIALGISPFTVNIGLPLILGLITTYYLFRLTMGILPVPFTAWVACVLLNQTLWMKDDLVSATPRAFVYPCFLAFLFYWGQFQQQQEDWAAKVRHNGATQLRQPDQASARAGEMRVAMVRSLSYCALALGLLGLFYPQYVLVAGGMLIMAFLGTILRQQGRKWRWNKWRREWRRNPKPDRSIPPRSPLNSTLNSPPNLLWQRLFYGVTLAVVAIVIGFYALSTSDYGPVVTLQQARAMAEFWPGGRTFFFSDNLWWFYAVGDRSGFLHVGLVRPATLSLGIFLPLLLHWRHRFPLTTAITPHIHRLSQLLLTSSLLFITAHQVLFRLHLPSRYTDHSLRIILAIATALTLTLLLDSLFTLHTPSPHHPITPSPHHPIVPAIATFLTLTLLLAYPLWVEPFPLTKYKIGRTPQIYAYLQTQPVDTVVASIAKTADNIPIFAQRSILVGHEYAIPYHTGYYDEFRQRAIALLQAQYSRDPDELIRFIQSYQVNFWLLEKNAYEPDFLRNHWTRQYLSDPNLSDPNLSDPTLTIATVSLGPEPLGPRSRDKSVNLSRSRRDRPVLQRWQPQCTVLTEADVYLIDAQCLVKRRTNGLTQKKLDCN
ncbi:MAG: hypothetical protein F6K30_01985 [Cyanothece sp. SIO2G6]|nr:hypothetical protein [Cyanothece sp. SIO2G6]